MSIYLGAGDIIGAFKNAIYARVKRELQVQSQVRFYSWNKVLGDNF